MKTNKMKSKDTKKLQKRARSKYLTSKLIIPLAELRTSLEKSYRNSYYCNQILMEHKGKLTGSYCKNRWCLVCSRIRIAHLIHGYKPELEAFKNPYFVTLTARTVDSENLGNRITKMVEIWRKIYKNSKGVKRGIKGVRKLECTSRPAGKYHPHFHFIIAGKDNATWIINQWLRLWRHEANPSAQDLRIADKKSMMELFKYFTKLMVKTENINLFTKKKRRVFMQTKRLDIIFQSMKGRRVYQALGIKKISEDVEEIATIDIDTGSLFKWKNYDWVEQNTGEYLSEWVPSKELKEIDFED